MEFINLFEAIAQMRRITQDGGCFSLIHATYNRDTKECHGKKYVKRARLRPQASKESVANADHKLFYYDLEDGQPLVCWQPLIMFFNGKQVITHE